MEGESSRHVGHLALVELVLEYAPHPKEIIPPVVVARTAEVGSTGVEASISVAEVGFHGLRHDEWRRDNK